MRGRMALVASICLGGALLAPAGAAAYHRHALVTGSGDCVVLAQQGLEPEVTLPEASFNNTSEPITTPNPHPLHVHVHKAEPGQHNTIFVYTVQTPCPNGGEYVNTP